MSVVYTFMTDTAVKEVLSERLSCHEVSHFCKFSDLKNAVQSNPPALLIVDKTWPQRRHAPSIIYPATLLISDKQMTHEQKKLFIANAGVPIFDIVSKDFLQQNAGFFDFLHFYLTGTMPSFNQIDTVFEKPLDSILGNSAPMLQVKNAILHYAKSETAVFISGESGSGKTFIARQIHRLSSRGKGQFRALNMTSIPENLAESVLFGHAKGAFTDAKEAKKGIIEQVDGGTLFLDEIGDISLNLQAKLLQVLETNLVHPVGASHAVKVDVRYIFATHRNLAKMCKDGDFRTDLYWRIQVLPLYIAPLRNHIEDLLLIANNFLQCHAKSLDDGAKEKLLHHKWYGNVRELLNCLQRAIVFAEGAVIKKEHIMFLSISPPDDEPMQYDIDAFNLF